MKEIGSMLLMILIGGISLGLLIFLREEPPHTVIIDGHECIEEVR